MAEFIFSEVAFQPYLNRQPGEFNSKAGKLRDKNIPNIGRNMGMLMSIHMRRKEAANLLESLNLRDELWSKNKDLEN